MRSLNPACKFISLLAVTLLLAGLRDPWWNLSAFALSMFLLLLSGVRLRSLLLYLIPVVLAAAGMFFTGYRFTAEGNMPVRSDAFLLSVDSNLMNGITQLSRVLAYAGLGYLFALTTDRVFMVRSFQKQFHLPQVFAHGLLAAWGIFPHMALEYRRTRAAFRARGIRVFPISPALLAPLLVKSVRWSEELSIAMESKGFSQNAERTESTPVRVHTKDIVFTLLCCIMLPAAAFLTRSII